MISKKRLLEYIKVTSDDLGDVEHDMFEMRRELNKLKLEVALLREPKSFDVVKRKSGRPKKNQ